MLYRAYKIVWEAGERFIEDDGWAISSHIALSTLMSLFPFLIVVTAMAGFFGSKAYADEVTRILLEAWPESVARPIAHELSAVLTTFRTDILTLGLVLALYFASNGVEALRVALNRAYDTREMRWWYVCRMESIGYTLVGAVVLLVIAFLVVLGPVLWATAVRHAPWLAPFGWVVLFIRVAAASAVLIAGLTLVHLYLPAGRRVFADVWPGILATLILWIVGGSLFGWYIANFVQNYINTYAGLSSVMVALVFFYYSAAIFVLGGELNAAVKRARGY